MSAFISKLILERGIGRDEWILDRLLAYDSDTAGLIEVPAGFKTDFASIPRIFHRLLPQNGEYDAPAIIHDYLYATGIFPKAKADLIFLEAMKALGVAWWKREAMYQAVNAFGWFAWNAHRAKTCIGHVVNQ